MLYDENIIKIQISAKVLKEMFIICWKTLHLILFYYLLF